MNKFVHLDLLCLWEPFSLSLSLPTSNESLISVVRSRYGSTCFQRTPNSAIVQDTSDPQYKPNRSNIFQIRHLYWWRSREMPSSNLLHTRREFTWGCILSLMFELCGRHSCLTTLDDEEARLGARRCPWPYTRDLHLVMMLRATSSSSWPQNITSRPWTSFPHQQPCISPVLRSIYRHLHNFHHHHFHHHYFYQEKTLLINIRPYSSVISLVTENWPTSPASSSALPLSGPEPLNFNTWAAWQWSPNILILDVCRLPLLHRSL
jgi:hypothetical protein